MFFHLLVSEFVNFGNQAVQEVTVVGYHNQCAVEIDQGLFQNIFCFKVERLRMAGSGSAV